MLLANEHVADIITLLCNLRWQLEMLVNHRGPSLHLLI